MLSEQEVLFRGASIGEDCRRNPGTDREFRGGHSERCASAATGPAKLVTRASDLGSANMRRNSGRSSTAGLWSCPWLAASRSSSSGMLLQRKNERREASSTSVIRCTGGPPAGSRSTRNTKFGLARIALQRGFDAGFECSGPVANLPRAVVKGHQTMEVRFADWLAVGAAGECRNDLLRALVVRGMARDYFAAAGRVSRTGRIEWTCAREGLDVRQSGPVEVVDRTSDVRLQPIGCGRRRALHERRGHFMRPGLDRDADTQAGIDGVSGIGGFFEKARPDRRVRPAWRAAPAARRPRTRPDARRQARA